MADNLLREVDEALRADRAAAFWQKNRSLIVTVVLALILGTAANSAWQKYREVQGGKTLAQFSEGQKQFGEGKSTEAAETFAAIANGASGEQAALARIWQARALVQAGKKDEAITALKAAVGGSSLWSDVACLRLAGLDAAAAKECLNAKANSPLAGERAQWAAAEQWAAGDAAGAMARLEQLIADEKTGQDVRAQLMQWVAIMKAQAGKKE